MMSKENNELVQNEYKRPQLYFVGTEDIPIYNITEHELETLHAGNIAGVSSQIFFVMIGIFVPSLISTIILSPNLLEFKIYLGVTSASGIAALITGLYWLFLKKNPDKIYKAIRERGQQMQERQQKSKLEPD